MDEAGGDVEEPAFRDVGVLVTARAELEARLSAQDVSENLALAVVVPAGSDAAFCSCSEEDRPIGCERDLTDEPWSRVSFGQPITGDGRDSFHGPIVLGPRAAARSRR